MGNTQITVSGLVATTPRSFKHEDGTERTAFRLASSERRFDRNQNRWIDGNTNWYTVNITGAMAKTAYESIHKGERVFLTGELNIRDFENGRTVGTAVEIHAEAIGHDLSWGTTVFTRTVLVKDTDNIHRSNAKDQELQELRQELADLKGQLRELGED